MKKFFSEPLVHFFLLGVLLYFLVSFIRSKTDKESREINVNSDRVALLINNYKNQMGVLPSPQQLEEMVNNYIKEEIAYREAKKMGLDKDDEIIRRRLSQKLEFLQSDLVELSTPTQDQLQAYYKENLALFTAMATVSFSHIYFNADNRPDSLVILKAEKVLRELQGINISHAPEKGDRFALQYDYTDQSAIDVKSNFGDNAIVDSLFRGRVGIWLGPVRSGYGWHLLYITKRDSSKVLPFEYVRDDVKAKYMFNQRIVQNHQAYEKMSKDYIINRNYLKEAK